MRRIVLLTAAILSFAAATTEAMAQKAQSCTNTCTGTPKSGRTCTRTCY
ncbi:MAG: hypothetical protein P4M07_22015 [Xanthobacteraceae bacterium]|nr:hypothetical protein [Xanthobacteraceae bacterium]